MGIGYDTVTDILQGNLGLTLLAALMLGKLLITAIAIGLGIPMGLIGPTLFIGAAAGGTLGLLGLTGTDIAVSEPGFYAMLGMGAMMGAVLQAPLAALLALLELTNNSNIIFPGLLAIVTATVTSRLLCRHGSVFQSMLIVRGLDWRRTPLEAALEQASVTSLMRRDFFIHEREISHSDAVAALGNGHDWILVTDMKEGRVLAVVATVDLKVYLQQQTDEELLDLMAIPALRRDMTPIDARATLKQALQRLDEERMDALFISDRDGAPQGFLFREDIQRFYTQHQNL
jgi:CIC family chloride channel protein